MREFEASSGRLRILYLTQIVLIGSINKVSDQGVIANIEDSYWET